MRRTRRPGPQLNAAYAGGPCSKPGTPSRNVIGTSSLTPERARGVQPALTLTLTAGTGSNTTRGGERNDDNKEIYPGRRHTTRGTVKAPQIKTDAAARRETAEGPGATQAPPEHSPATGSTIEGGSLPQPNIQQPPAHTPEALLDMPTTGHGDQEVTKEPEPHGDREPAGRMPHQDTSLRHRTPSGTPAPEYRCTTTAPPTPVKRKSQPRTSKATIASMPSLRPPKMGTRERPAPVCIPPPGLVPPPLNPPGNTDPPPGQPRRSGP